MYPQLKSRVKTRIKGTYKFVAKIPKLLLYPGNYTLTTWFRKFTRESSDDFVESALTFRVIKSQIECAECDFSFVRDSGGVYVKSLWNYEKLIDENI